MLLGCAERHHKWFYAASESDPGSDSVLYRLTSYYQTGSTKAISDITPAAGWTILECDPNSMAMDIRAVCTGDADSCNHMYQGGAVGTLVRLPPGVSGNMTVA